MDYDALERRLREFPQFFINGQIWLQTGKPEPLTTEAANAITDLRAHLAAEERNSARLLSSSNTFESALKAAREQAELVPVYERDVEKAHAEIRHMTEYIEAWGPDPTARIESLEADLKAARDENERLRKDAERYRDQIDADYAAKEFLEAERAKITDRPCNYVRHNIALGEQITDGRVTSLWCDSHLIAVALVLRDDLNYSVLVRAALTPRVP